MAKQYKTRVVSVSLPNELDDYLNLILDNLSKEGHKITKSKFITTILYSFVSSTIKEAEENKIDSKA